VGLKLFDLQVEVDEEGCEVELGRGAFGVVVKGTYRMAPVAIKRLQQQSAVQQESFLREMAILRACRGSRYIVPFVGASLLPVGTCPSPAHLLLFFLLRPLCVLDNEAAFNPGMHVPLVYLISRLLTMATNHRPL